LIEAGWKPIQIWWEHHYSMLSPSDETVIYVEGDIFREDADRPSEA
jgi:hypothetical protein